MKEKRYKRIKDSIMVGAGTGIVAGMILMGTGSAALAEGVETGVPAYSQNASNTGMHIMHRWNSPTKVSSLASSLGLDREAVREGIKSGKTLKQVLQDNGIVPSQIQKAFGEERGHKKGWRKNVI